MKCENCSSDALFEYRITQDLSQFYCGKHLPRFLEDRRRAGTLGITKAHVDEYQAAMELIKSPAAPNETADPAPSAPKRTRKRKINADNS